MNPTTEAKITTDRAEVLARASQFADRPSDETWRELCRAAGRLRGRMGR